MNIPRRFLLQTLGRLACLLALWAAGAAAETPERVTITVLGTTDLHGSLFPIDYYAGTPANRGLVKIATLVRQIRAEQPHVLLVDSGDTIQGSPLAYYFARKEPARPNPTIAVMNAMRYDAMAVGNHEFNFGLDVLEKARRESRFAWLAANVRADNPTRRRRFGSYIIRNVAGVRVGILGFITPGVPRWEIPAHYKGFRFDDIVKTAQQIVPRLRRKVDVLIVIAHSGMERDTASSEAFSTVPRENVIAELARSVPGIDVILFGHSHRELPEQMLNGVLLAQAKNWAQSLARADIVMERSATRRWRVAAKRSSTIPVTPAVPHDPEIEALARPYHEATQAYLDTPVATSPRAMDGLTARYEDHPFVDLIHRVQIEYGGADVSMATLFLPSARVPAGPVTVRQLAALYIYENTLYTVEMTGEQLRQALEQAASFYPAWPLKEGEALRLPGYNADCAQGVSYVVDLTRPVGQRVRDLTYGGQPLDPARKLRVATNNYRYTGGGQYPYKGLPVVYRSPREIRELILESVSRAGQIPGEADGNWRLVPREAVEAMVAEARRREEERAAGAASGSLR